MNKWIISDSSNFWKEKKTVCLASKKLGFPLVKALGKALWRSCYLIWEWNNEMESAMRGLVKGAKARQQQVLRAWGDSLQELTKAIVNSCVRLSELLSLCEPLESEDNHSDSPRFAMKQTFFFFCYEDSIKQQSLKVKCCAWHMVDVQ